MFGWGLRGASGELSPSSDYDEHASQPANRCRMCLSCWQLLAKKTATSVTTGTRCASLTCVPLRLPICTNSAWHQPAVPLHHAKKQYRSAAEQQTVKFRQHATIKANLVNQAKSQRTSYVSISSAAANLRPSYIKCQSPTNKCATQCSTGSNIWAQPIHVASVGENQLLH